MDVCAHLAIVGSDKFPIIVQQLTAIKLFHFPDRVEHPVGDIFKARFATDDQAVFAMALISSGFILFWAMNSSVSVPQYQQHSPARVATGRKALRHRELETDFQRLCARRRLKRGNAQPS